VVYFSQGCWWNSNRGSVSFVPLRSCIVLRFLVSTMYFKSPHWYKCSGRRSGWILHTLLYLVHILTLQNVMNTGFRYQSHESIAIQTSWRLWRPLTLSQHFHHQLNCEVFRAFLAHILHSSISTKLILQPRNCYTCCWWAKLISLSLHLITFSLSNSI
jgi:hypothetical protein